jgi:hypothetical protein
MILTLLAEIDRRQQEGPLSLVSVRTDERPPRDLYLVGLLLPTTLGHTFSYDPVIDLYLGPNLEAATATINRLQRTYR